MQGKSRFDEVSTLNEYGHISVSGVLYLEEGDTFRVPIKEYKSAASARATYFTHAYGLEIVLSSKLDNGAVVFKVIETPY